MDYYSVTRRHNLKIKYTENWISERKLSVSISAPKRSNGKTVLYVNNQPSPEDIGLMVQPPYSVRGEIPDIDKLWSQYNRLEVKLMKQGLKDIIPEIVELLNKEDNSCDTSILENNPIEFKFNRYAGCSCGCSPGFHLKINGKNIHLKRFHDVNIFVNLFTKEQLIKYVNNMVFFCINLINKLKY